MFPFKNVRIYRLYCVVVEPKQKRRNKKKWGYDRFLINCFLLVRSKDCNLDRRSLILVFFLFFFLFSFWYIGGKLLNRQERIKKKKNVISGMKVGVRKCTCGKVKFLNGVLTYAVHLQNIFCV